MLYIMKFALLCHENRSFKGIALNMSNREYLEWSQAYGKSLHSAPHEIIDVLPYTFKHFFGKDFDFDNLEYIELRNLTFKDYADNEPMEHELIFFFPGKEKKYKIIIQAPAPHWGFVMETDMLRMILTGFHPDDWMVDYGPDSPDEDGKWVLNIKIEITEEE